VHLPLNIADGEGVALSEHYHIGNTFPVYVLTDSTGSVITQWTGYTGSKRFIAALNGALRDLTTIEERVARCRARPVLRDVLVLAKYHADINDYLAAIEYYRQAEDLARGGKLDYAYQIFTNTASAVWDDLLPFQKIHPAAERVLSGRNKDNIVKAVQMFGSLARKKNRLEELPRYLKAGLDATVSSQNEQNRQARDIFTADLTLYVSGDTAEALRQVKESQGPAWESDPKKLFVVGRWCFQRRVNLEQSEHYLRAAIGSASPGRFKAMALHTLAELRENRGFIEEAIRLVTMAREESPENRYYVRELSRLQDKLERE